MNDTRFSKVLLVVLLVLAFAVTNAVGATQAGQELFPVPANEIDSFEQVMLLAEADGGISGTVTDGTNPIVNIEVFAYRQSGSYWDYVGWVHSDVTGHYDIGHLPSGTYRISFSDNDNYIYLGEYYNDAPDLDSATDISVTAGSTTSGIDAVLTEGGHITGTVTDGTNPLEGIEVIVYHWTGSEYDWSNFTYTDTWGNYDLSGLPSGNYRVGFHDFFGVYSSEYYDDAPDLSGATDISVSAGSTTSTIDAMLTERGHITGTVTSGTNPLPDIEVTAYFWTGSGYDWSNSTYTDTAGNYDIGRLPSGTYRVQFSDMVGIYVSEYYDNAPDLDSATDISVTAGSTTSGIDAVLAELGHISGTVTDGTNPLQGIDVQAYQWTGSYYKQHWPIAHTNATGNYDLSGLPTGTYRLEFSDLFDRVYLTEYYDNAPDLESATDISVTVGSTTSGIDAVMVKGGHISGTVSDGTNPLPGIAVMVYQWTGSDYKFLHSPGTDASGSYDMGHLPTGIYRVQFQDQWNGVYASEWYDDAPDPEGATDISVTAGSTTSGVDAVLAKWGHITGTVTDGTNPLPSIEVRAYRWTGSDYDGLNYTLTDASGNFDIGHLPTGTYRVEFFDIDYVYSTEWYDDAPDLDSATDISVTAGSTTSGIDAVLKEPELIYLPSIIAR